MIRVSVSRPGLPYDGGVTLLALEAVLAAGVAILKLALEALSALCVGLGLLATLRSAFGPDRALPKLRLEFGAWLALALEFQLGADIVATTVAPSFEALGKLALIAIVRTFLNYFLQRELVAVSRET